MLTEAQMRLLRKARGRLVDPEQHIEAPHPGHLLCQDTYFVGTIKGVGKIENLPADGDRCALFARFREAVSVLREGQFRNVARKVIPLINKHAPMTVARRSNPKKRSGATWSEGLVPP